MVVIQIDSREKSKAIKGILREFERQGVKYYVSKLYVGDYMLLDNPKLVIDRKQNLNEVASNVCQEHERFINELKRAQEVGIYVIILIEHGRDVKSLSDVVWWENPRLKESPKAIRGEVLYKIMKTISERYDIEWRFCEKSQTGKEILRILQNEQRRDIADSQPEDGAGR